MPQLWPSPSFPSPYCSHYGDDDLVRRMAKQRCIVRKLAALEVLVESLIFAR